MNRKTKRFEKELNINGKDYTAYFDVDGVLGGSYFSHGFGIRTETLITCDPHEDLMVIDNEGLEVTDQKIITEANNSIDSQDYIEEFDSSEFH